MSIQDYETAKRLIDAYQDKADFAGPQPESLVRAAEAKLGVEFPPLYRRFLLEYGVGGMGGFEIYGIIQEDFDHSGIPDAIWYSLQEQRDSNLPRGFVAICNSGDGEIICLDCEDLPTEPPVMVFEPGYPLEEQCWEVVAEDFGEFFLGLVKNEIQHFSRPSPPIQRKWYEFLWPFRKNKGDSKR